MAGLIPRKIPGRLLLAALSLCLFPVAEAAAREGEIDFDYSDSEGQSFYFNWHDYREIPEGYARFDASVRTRESFTASWAMAFTTKTTGQGRVRTRASRGKIQTTASLGEPCFI